MYEISFSRKEHVHFIGIGGISMSGLAEILARAGFTVTGSDAHASELTELLENDGIRVVIGQSAANIEDGTDVVVYTAAIHPDNPEYEEAVRRGIPLLTRAELLGQIMRNYGTAIAVAGTHGKTTTTGMTSQVLLTAGADPTVTIGGIFPSIGGNIRVGNSDTFITEACEYTNSFLSFYPTIAMILNVDADHLDFFKDIDDIAQSFHRFAALLPEDGTLIIRKDTNRFGTVVNGLSCRIRTFSLTEDADYTAKDITYDEQGRASFTCMEDGRELCRFTLAVPGEHNVANALATAAAARTLGYSAELIAEGLAEFTGTKRRFEYKGEKNGVTVIDDYAHHPAEIAATLAAARKTAKGRIVVVFQPHTYTRTKALLPEFAKVLSDADHIVLADIYAAREKNTIGISSQDLCDAVVTAGGDAVYFPSFREIEDHLLSYCRPGDLLLTVGAGDVYKIGEEIL